ncbi:MAG: hypothetical protein IKU07_09185 [Oscillospiraceae bacterium]|nr:hypothetical protein [Oscillospiraceae bacterium]
MKRFVSFLLAIVMVLSMMPAVAFAAEVRTVYFDPTSGSDASNGLTEGAPVKTLEKAYAALSGADEGIIVFLSTLELAAETTFPASAIPVTLTSKTGSEGISSSKNILFAGDTTLENMAVSINAASNSTFISAEGHDLTIGENVTTAAFKSGSTNYFFCITGSYYADNVDGMHLTVTSGTWRNIYAAAYKEEVTGNVQLTVTGGRVPNNIAPSYSANVKGNVEMNISGVNVQTNICGTPSGSSAVLTGNVTVTLGDGIISGTIKPTKQASGKVSGKVTVIVDGDISGTKGMAHGSSSGTAGSTELILKSGVLACSPCTFDKITVDIASGKTLVLDSCVVTADTAKTAGTLLFRGAATLTAKAVTGTLNCAIDGTVSGNHTYLSTPANAAVAFPADSGITENQGLWGMWGDFDEASFQGLVIRVASDVSVTMHTGLEDGTTVIPTYIGENEGISSYYFKNLSGYYRYTVSGTGYYTITKNIYMSPEKNATLTEVEATPGKMAGTGWETASLSDLTDEASAMVMELTPEMQEKYADVFTTPIFTSNNADHQMTTQSQMEDYLQSLDGADDDMYVYSIGKTQKNRDIPIVFFTRTDLSSATDLEEAASLMGQGKPTILYRAQVHGNEASSGEGALAVISRLDGAFGAEVLDRVNVCVIPRTNPDGAYNYNRALANSKDGNRDNLRLTTPEIQAFMHAYQVIMPEMVLDGHEFNLHNESEYLTPGDVIISVGETPVNGTEFKELSLTMMYNAFDTMTENGMTYRYYSNYVNGPDANVMCSFMGRQGTLAMLLEVRGIGYGLTNFPRRVLSHVISAESAITYVAEHAAQVQRVVDAERQRIIDNGSIYNEEEQVILSSVATSQPDKAIQIVYTYQDGTQKTVTSTPKEYDTIARSRIAPTAYVIAAGESYTEDVLTVVRNHDIEYEFLPAGTTLLLQQYTGTATEAGLTEEKLVTFPKGAYVFYKNQFRGITLSMLMEPDVTDLATYKGTFAQRGMLPVEATYRYCHDLNENGKVDTHKLVYVSQSQGSDSNDGLTEVAAVATIDAAYAKLQALVAGGEIGVVMFLDTYTMDSYSFPACDFKVLLTSKTGAEGITYTPTSSSQPKRFIAFNSETCLENLTLTYTKSSLSCIKANGHKLTIGAGVTCLGTAGSYLNLIGGTYESDEKAQSTELIIRSGHWRNIYAGGFNDGVTGDVKLTMTNAVADSNVVPSRAGETGGNVTMYFENVTVGSGIYGGNSTRNNVLGDVTITLGENVSAASGVWAGSSTEGNVNGTVTVIAAGADLAKLAVHGTAKGGATVGKAVLQLARNLDYAVTIDPAFALDLNGCDITGDLTVNGSLAVYDSATDDYTVADGIFGEITGAVSGTLVAKGGYIAAENGFHKFDQYISGVSLRPGTAGIYYTATFKADEILAKHLETGVAVSLADMPTADFETDEDTLYTKGTTGVLVNNILKGDPEDADRSILDIYAASYAKLPDGTVLVSDGEIAYSLYDILLLLKTQNAAAFQSFTEAYNIASWF